MFLDKIRPKNIFNKITWSTVARTTSVATLGHKLLENLENVPLHFYGQLNGTNFTVQMLAQTPLNILQRKM